MIATVFLGLVLAIGIHVEAGPTPNSMETDQCPESHQERILDCVTSKIELDFDRRAGHSCERAQFANECIASINGNCATDARYNYSNRFYYTLSKLQDNCDIERHTNYCTSREDVNKIHDCVNSAMKQKYGNERVTYCELVEVQDECVASINGNCLKLFSYVKHMCEIGVVRP